MSPSNAHISSQLRHLIYYYLDNDFLQNALFLSGRLYAHEMRSAEASHLVALCHFRLGEYQLAYEYSKPMGMRGTHVGCAFIYAKSCLQRPHRHKEGIGALERSRSQWAGRNSWDKHSETTRRHLPDAAAVYCLLGKLWHGYGDPTKAIDYYVEALKLNPFMWDAFLGLCHTGANIRIPNIFVMTPEMLAYLSSSTSDPYPEPASLMEDGMPNGGPLQSQHKNPLQPTAHADPFSIPPSRPNSDAGAGFGGGSAALFQKLNESTSTNKGSPTGLGGGGGLAFDMMETPTGTGHGIDSSFHLGPDIGGGGGGGGGGMSVVEAMDAPHAPLRKHRNFAGMDFSRDNTTRLRAATARARGPVRGEMEELGEASRTSSSVAAGGERKRNISGQATQSAASQIDPSAAPQRRSVRLFNQIRPTSSKFAASTGSLGLREGRELKKAKAPGAKGRTTASGSTMGRTVAGNRKAGEPSEVDAKENQQALFGAGASAALGGKAGSPEPSKKMEAIQWLLDLFAKLGGGYFALAHFHCTEALQMFQSLVTPQRDTTWVLAQMGRAYHEKGWYREAEKHFRKVRTLAPARLEDMEIYSTVLWHLKDEVELAYLAHELIDLDRLSPQAWCAVGNTFSLQRDHDQALECFKRATQLDPTLAYAYTHQGHEHMMNEEFDKALVAYRSGVAADHRYYNAWYGLGKVYEKMGKYDVAEKHFRTAAGINPTNAVLVFCIGMVLEKLKNPRAALVQYAEACTLDATSSKSRFNKARVLMALQEPHLALVELKILKDSAPDDAKVHFLLGKLYKTLRQRASAIKHFTIALNLDPKAGQYIKGAIESLEDDEVEDAEMS
ncbi:MAG: anaphase-promoting complex subunit cdc27 [Thelocarpon superellum]|nr:MAG: anaphase-promoting complex subunit cdc27 [Thelocarpon superellum]